MPQILRVKVRWSGFTGSPGFTVLHFRDFGGTNPTTADAQAACDMVDTFLTAIVSLFNNSITSQVEADTEAIDEATGILQSVITVVPDPPHAGTGGASAAYSAASGAVISWQTAGIRNGRRIRGRTFIVPITVSCYDSTGTLSSSVVTTLNNAATALRDLTGIADLGVYARPTGPGATDGVWHAVSGHRVPDMAAVLRSRRD